eukprot:758651-Hanusia_phi.AAC.5
MEERKRVEAQQQLERDLQSEVNLSYDLSLRFAPDFFPASGATQSNRHPGVLVAGTGADSCYAVAPVVEADPARVIAPTLAAQAYMEVRWGLASETSDWVRRAWRMGIRRPAQGRSPCRKDEDEVNGRLVTCEQEKNFYSGYTIDRLMQDTRHRLAVALHEAGKLEGNARSSSISLSPSFPPPPFTVPSMLLLPPPPPARFCLSCHLFELQWSEFCHQDWTELQPHEKR